MTLIKWMKIFINKYNETVSQQLSVNWQAVATETLHELMKTEAHQNTMIHYWIIVHTNIGVLINSTKKNSSYCNFLTKAEKWLNILRKHDQHAAAQIIEKMIRDSIQILKKEHDKMSMKTDLLADLLSLTRENDWSFNKNVDILSETVCNDFWS